MENKVKILSNEILHNADVYQSKQQKKMMKCTSLNSEDSRNFLQGAKINPVATNIPMPAFNIMTSSEFSFKTPQATTMEYESTSGSTLKKQKLTTPIDVQPVPKKTRKPRQTKASIKKQTDLFDGPKKDFTEDTLPKVSRLSTIIEEVGDKKTRELCDKIRAMELTTIDVKCQVDNIVANIFVKNRISSEEGFVDREGEMPEFMEIIAKGLKTPKYYKRKITIEELAKQVEPELKGESSVKEEEVEAAEDEILADGDFVAHVDAKGVLKLDDIVPNITDKSWYGNYKPSLMRFHQIKNEPEVKMPKIKEDDLNITYNPRMARVSRTPVQRTAEEQRKRDKNTMATRVTRTRAKVDEEQVEIKSACFEQANIEARRRIACLIAYLDVLTAALGAQPRNWLQVTEELMAKEFMDEQERLALMGSDDEYETDTDEEDEPVAA